MEYRKKYDEVVRRAQLCCPRELFNRLFPDFEQTVKDNESYREGYLEGRADAYHEIIQICAEKEEGQRKILLEMEPVNNDKELTPEEKMNHPLFLEGFDTGREVEKMLSGQKTYNKTKLRFKCPEENERRKFIILMVTVWLAALILGLFVF